MESVSVDITLGMISASQPVVNQRYGVRFLTVGAFVQQYVY